MLSIFTTLKTPNVSSLQVTFALFLWLSQKYDRIQNLFIEFQNKSILLQLGILILNSIKNPSNNQLS